MGVVTVCFTSQFVAFVCSAHSHTYTYTTCKCIINIYKYKTFCLLCKWVWKQAQLQCHNECISCTTSTTRTNTSLCIAFVFGTIETIKSAKFLSINYVHAMKNALVLLMTKQCNCIILLIRLALLCNFVQKLIKRNSNTKPIFIYVHFGHFSIFRGKKNLKHFFLFHLKSFSVEIYDGEI